MNDGGRKIIDITQPIAAGMDVWPGDPQTEVDTEEISGAIVSTLKLSAHAATHVDAPRHRNIDKSGVESLDLEILCGPAVVVRPTRLSNDCTLIEELPPSAFSAQRILIDTGHFVARQRGTAEFLAYPGLSPNLAEKLIASGVLLIGTDAPSIERSTDLDMGNFEVHDELFGADVIILENLKLDHVAEGQHELFCLPLLIPGADGAPARAVLFTK